MGSHYLQQLGPISETRQPTIENAVTASNSQINWGTYFATKMSLWIRING